MAPEQVVEKWNLSSLALRLTRRDMLRQMRPDGSGELDLGPAAAGQPIGLPKLRRQRQTARSAMVSSIMAASSQPARPSGGSSHAFISAMVCASTPMRVHCWLIC